MHRDITGRYPSSLAGGEVVNAFMPNPLPPVPPVVINEVRQRLLDRATLTLCRLDSVSTLLPDPQTNGGLLFTVKTEGLEAVKSLLGEAGLGAHAEPIGRMVELGEKAVRVISSGVVG